MPNVSMPISNLNQSVERLVQVEAVKQLQKILEINNTKIIFPGDIKKMQQSNSSIDSPGENRDITLTSNRLTYIEVTEEYDPESVAMMTVHRTNYPPFFKDPYLGVVIRPIYANSVVTITIRYVTNSRVEMTRWYSEMVARAGRLRQNVFLHSFSYHYLIPDVYLDILKEIHYRREAVCGFNESIKDYFNRYGTNRLTYVTTENGDYQSMSVAETQSRVVGLLEIEPLPDKPEKDNDTVTWEASFTYKFTYEKPISVNMVYPVIVHGQLLPNEYIEFNNTEDNLDNMNKEYRSVRMDALGFFETTALQDRYYNRYKHVTIPYFDDRILETRHVYAEPLFTVLCTLDEDNPNFLFNLGDIDGYHVDSIILDWLRKGEYKYITKSFFSIFHISLFRGVSEAGDEMLRIDKDLNVYLNKPVNLRQELRVRFYLYTDIDILVPQAIYRLFQDKLMTIVMMKYIREAIWNNGTSKRVANMHISKLELEMIANKYSNCANINNLLEWLKTHDYNKDNYSIGELIGIVPVRTVMTTYIQAIPMKLLGTETKRRRYHAHRKIKTR